MNNDLKTLQKIVVNELNDAFPEKKFFEDGMYTTDEMGASIEFGEITVDEMLMIRDIINKYDCILDYVYAGLTTYDDAVLCFVFVKRPQ